MSNHGDLDENNGQPEQQRCSPAFVFVEVTSETEISAAELVALERLLGADLRHLLQ
jgi:hypothetical protein